MNAPDITNEAFLRGIFGAELEADECPIVLPLAGPIHDRTKWGFGWAWRPGRGNLTAADVNWFFTLSVYRPDAAGEYRRQKAQFARAFGVFCDDIGNVDKAPNGARVAGFPPSYLIETSLGSHHAGYLFDTPVGDLERVEALQDALVLAGLCDPGAKGPAARLGRLPVAINNKAQYVQDGRPPHRVRLVEWHPERRYSIEAIAEGLELMPQQAKRSPPAAVRRKPTARPAADEHVTLPAVEPPRKVATRGAAQEDDDEGDFVHRPRAAENAVIAALRLAGLYRASLGNGKHDVSCPWRAEHTGAVDNGAAYFEPNELFPLGGFKCMHGHCAGRKVGHLIRHLGVDFHDARHRPTIRVQPGDLHRVTDAAELELRNLGGYFQRGGLVTRCISDPVTGETSLVPIDARALARVLSAAARWEKFDGRRGQWVVTDPPVRHVDIIATATEHRHLLPLAGLARQPHLREDGSLCAASGYDERTRLLGVFDAHAYRVAAVPTRDEAQAALALLCELLAEFGFARAQDHAAAVCAMLTAAIRPSLPTAPMVHAKAHQPGSGKSYLTSIIAAFAGPGRPAFYSFPHDKEECGKVMLTALASAPACVVFDNLTGDLLPFGPLLTALTEETIQGRLLGFNKEARFSTRTVFLSSGNNVGPVRDMARRTLVVNLDPRCETPATRRYNADPLARVRRERSTFVSAALTLVRAGIVAQADRALALPPLGGFDLWSRWARAPLVWLGLPDPCGSVFEAIAEDPDREQLQRMVGAWRTHFGQRPVGVRDLIAAADKFTLAPKCHELEDAIREVAEERGDINRRRLGRWIARNEGRIVDGLRLERARGVSGSARWAVVRVEAEDAAPRSATLPSPEPARRPWDMAEEAL